jgi:hypothetical protein
MVSLDNIIQLAGIFFITNELWGIKVVLRKILKSKNQEKNKI